MNETKIFFMRLLIPTILVGLSFLFEHLTTVSVRIVTLFRWTGIVILGLILLLQVVQMGIDFYRQNFSKQEENKNGK